MLDQTNELIELFYKNRHRSSQDVCVAVGGRHSETFNFDYQILKSRRIIQAMTSEMFGFIRSSDQFRIWGSKLLLHDDHETVMKSLGKYHTLIRYNLFALNARCVLESLGLNIILDVMCNFTKFLLQKES